MSKVRCRKCQEEAEETVVHALEGYTHLGCIGGAWQAIKVSGEKILEDAERQAHVRLGDGRLETAKNIIASNERTIDALRRRAIMLADECGKLKDENTQLLAENARLRRSR